MALRMRRVMCLRCTSFLVYVSPPSVPHERVVSPSTADHFFLTIKVYANAEKEFYLSRMKLIQQSWRSVQKARQPAPLNLAMPTLGFVVDVAGLGWDLVRPRGQPLTPFSETYEWVVAMGVVHRMAFALIMGPLAFALSALLWMVSLPWVAWQLQLWQNFTVRKLGTRAHEVALDNLAYPHILFTTYLDGKHNVYIWNAG